MGGGGGAYIGVRMPKMPWIKTLLKPIFDLGLIYSDMISISLNKICFLGLCWR
jgi:hypothetical protein